MFAFPGAVAKPLLLLFLFLFTVFFALRASLVEADAPAGGGGTHAARAALPAFMAVRGGPAPAPAPPPAPPPPPPGALFSHELSLFVGVLSRNSPEGAGERAAFRATSLRTLALSPPRAAAPWQVAHRFFVTTPAPGAALLALEAEAARFGDLVLLADEVVEAPPRADKRTLSQRVHHMFRWAVRARATWVLKTDTDAFVHFPRLLAALALAPRAGFGWGRLGGPNDWTHPTAFVSSGLPAAARPYFSGTGTPYYLAGLGYVLSVDLLADAAERPFGAMLDCEYLEDVCTGLRLIPYKPAYRPDVRFCEGCEGCCPEAPLVVHHLDSRQLHEHLRAALALLQPSPPPTPPAGGRRAVFTVDNRPLERDLATAGYPSLAAAINFHYALLHGYNFSVLQPVFSAAAVPAAAAALAAGACPPLPAFAPEDLEGALAEVARQPAPAQVKNNVTAWHPGTGQFRAASWAKLPLLWRALEGFASAADAALYLDSDAIVARRDVDFFGAFTAPRDGKLVWGDDASRAALVFGVNAPYDLRYPCAGVLLARGGGGGRALLRAWWDTPAHARRHAYEQDALWGLLQRWEAGACPNPHFSGATVAVVAARQFPAAANPEAYAHAFSEEGPPLAAERLGEFGEDAWIHHTQWWMGGRAAVMRRRIAELGISSDDFSALIDRIRGEHTVPVDVLKAAMDMHEETCAAPPLEPPCSSFYS